MNPSKCHIMHATRKKDTHTQRPYHQRLDREYCSHRDLPRGRAIIRPHLEHTSEKRGSKTNRTLSFIRRIVITSSPEANAVAYKTLVPQMEYSTFITDPPQIY